MKPSNMYQESELNVAMKCIKYMLFVANFMFILVGFLLISIGSTIEAIYSDFDQFTYLYYYSASKLAIGVGVIIFFVALFGCMGAIKESVCLINTYALFLFCILILEICITVLAYSMRGNIKKTIRCKMEESMDMDYTWNATQYNLKCCGVVGPNDWYKFSDKYNLDTVKNGNKIIYKVPGSCCFAEHCRNINSVYQVGCLDKISYIISECALLLGVGAMCVSSIQILGVIFAQLLAKSLRKLKSQIQVIAMERRQQFYNQIKNNAKNQTAFPVLDSASCTDC